MSKSHRAATHVIGWREQIALPELGITSLKAKIDTGARTSAIHAIDAEEYSIDGKDHIRFRVPLANLPKDQHCEALLVDRRDIKNTSGKPETRYVIRTTLVLAKRHWHIELSLANREQMGFDLILGRTAIRGRRLLVHPGRSFLCGPPQQPTVNKPPSKYTRTVHVPSTITGSTDTYALEEEE